MSSKGGSEWIAQDGSTPCRSEPSSRAIINFKYLPCPVSISVVFLVLATLHGHGLFKGPLFS